MQTSSLIIYAIDLRISWQKLLNTFIPRAEWDSAHT